MIGLYVHIPFCEKKCHYCNFVITGRGPAEKQSRFLDALEKETAHYAPRFEGTVFDTLYIGGGTPSTLTPAETERLFSLIQNRFHMKHPAEVTLEANPGDVSEEKARLYRALGVTRVSLGAQSFNDDTLKRLNRAHGSREISESFKNLRKAGFQNISLDVILSLPGETMDDVKVSLNALAALDPEHVSVYELTIEEKTVFGRAFRDGTLKLPAEEKQLETLCYTQDYLREKGFLRYELLSYAKTGFESRHNLLYWANEDYLGLGPGAFSYFDGRRFRSSASFEEYMQKIERSDWSAYEQETLTPEKKEIESLLLALRLREGAEIKRFDQVLPRLSAPVQDLIEKNLLIKESGRIRLTPKGQLFAETVFSELSAVS